MKIKNLKSALVIFTLLLTVGLYAQPPGGGRNGGGQRGGPQRGGQPNASEILSKLDVNNDGKISREEASKDQRGKISEDFDEIDANEDGFIELEEIENSLNNRKPKKQNPEMLINKIDDNNDGTLNKLEVAAKKNRMLLINFDEIDTNNDGELDVEELKVFFEKNKKPKRRKRN